MKFSAPLIEGRLIQRYKRFLADVELTDGTVITAHCANPGSMLGLKEAGSRVFLSKSDSPSRKLKYSWELVEAAPDGENLQLIGINSSLANRLVAEALADKRLEPFKAYDDIKAEVKYGEASRVDFLLRNTDAPPCYLEVKNCHMMRKKGLAEFPDSVTKRGARHLRELANMVAQGAHAALVYVIQMQADQFDVARDIDPEYDHAFKEALAAGVKSYAYTCDISPEGISIAKPVPIVA
ncbi:DNA/RNA nuclease SfsA [Microvirga sp. W0021]|uniref:Sugar fermentation stimulation protein homolog n=1 Tax=Hohaiivirga grylli TaxID=3133970 RepID=A0ABV0BKH3_9HYPH